MKQYQNKFRDQLIAMTGQCVELRMRDGTAARGELVFVGENMAVVKGEPDAGAGGEVTVKILTLNWIMACAAKHREKTEA